MYSISNDQTVDFITLDLSDPGSVKIDWSAAKIGDSGKYNVHVVGTVVTLAGTFSREIKQELKIRVPCADSVYDATTIKDNNKWSNIDNIFLGSASTTLLLKAWGI